MGETRHIARFYGKWAGLYEVLARRTPGIRRVRDRAVDSLRISRGETVVEMGCGTGANFAYLRDRVGPEGVVLGLDVTPEMVAYANRRVRREDWDNVFVLRGDARMPPISSADAILATFVTGMFRDPAAVVKQWCGLLSDTGRITLLDAAIPPSLESKLLRWLFGLFVYVSAPKQSRRERDDLAELLTMRVDAAHHAVAEEVTTIQHDSFVFDVLQLCTGRKTEISETHQNSG